jgi:hypothetical protein
MRCSQARRAPFIYTEVKAGATRHGFDVQRMIGKFLHQPRNFVIVELFSSPILFATGIHSLPVLPPHPKLPQGLP